MVDKLDLWITLIYGAPVFTSMWLQAHNTISFIQRLVRIEALGARVVIFCRIEN